ncbi:MAG: HD domain-containing protein [Lachnospiraceae bacterium]|nr:HD domain-containing protein [Lachnospiraceae bacterium]
MLYTPLTRKAMKIAYDAHHGQLDYSGVPYVFHAYEVASGQKTETAVCAALLHDVVEDTEVTIEQLKEEFPEEIIEVVKLLTHGLDDDYAKYIERIRSNPIATAIKQADLKHNSNESRLDGVESVTEEQRAWWKEKYKMAKAILESDK